MKKLVKTAKQQFEERLRSLNVLTTHKVLNHLILHLCENENKEMSILHESEECGYHEYKFQGSYQSMIESEEFLYAIVCRFNEIGEPVKNIFDWYASADKDLTPFTVYEILQLGLYLESETVTFGDIYEEVPDVRIITAKEQWEDASKNAKVAATIGNGTIYKVEVTEQFISFYVFKGDSYSLSVFPPFSELRKDNKFIIKYLELVRMGHDSDMDLALSWLAGGEYKMSELSLLDIYESAQEISSMEFEDKEIPQEQTIEQMIALTPKQQEAVRKFEEAAQTLKDSGAKVICYYDQNEYYVINGNYKLVFDNVIGCDMNGHKEYENISSIIENNHVLKFSWDLYWGCDYNFCAKKI